MWVWRKTVTIYFSWNSSYNTPIVIFQHGHWNAKCRILSWTKPSKIKNRSGVCEYQQTIWRCSMLPVLAKCKLHRMSIPETHACYTNTGMIIDLWRCYIIYIYICDFRYLLIPINLPNLYPNFSFSGLMRQLCSKLLMKQFLHCQLIILGTFE